MDRGNKDQSPHRKVRSNHDLDFRKSRLIFTSTILIIPAILFLIFWANEGGYGNREWKTNLFIVGSGLVGLGCLIIHLFSFMNKDVAFLNLMSFLCLFFGGLLYLLAAIGNAVTMAYWDNNSNNISFVGLNQNDNPDNIIDIKDGIYLFGLHSLFAFSAMVLAIDCISDLYFAQNLRILSWSFPLLWASWFAFGYWLYYHKNQLTWWQLCAKAGFGTIAISILILMILTGMRILSKVVGIILSICAFLGSVLVWIYCARIIYSWVFNGHDACLYIGLPFLLSGITLFLFYDSLLGTREPKDGAGAKTVHYPQDPGHRDVRVPVDGRDNRV